MAKPWMRLDCDFYLDRKVEALEDRRKEVGVLKLVKLYLVATEVYGRLDLADADMRGYTERRVKLKGKRLDSFIDDCVDCGLFNRELWETLHVVTSDRLHREGEKRSKLEQQRREAAQKSVEARKREKEESASTNR